MKQKLHFAKQKIGQFGNTKVTVVAGQLFTLSLQVGLFLILPAVLFTLITSKTEYIQGIKSFVVQTGSMTPALPVGSVIYIQKELGYKPGDMIAFKNAADQTVTHRVTGVGFRENVIYITKGDANKAIDADPVPADRVLGKVFFHIPQVGYLIEFLKMPQGFALAVILPTIAFILSELWAIKKEVDRHIERRIAEKLRSETLISA